jgi:radical SAM superfamily enzyme YgiQ (UPF0313 family)
LKKKVLLLVNPVNSYRRGFANHRTFTFPPVAFGIIAAKTPNNWKVKVLDENFQNFRYRDADLVGITSFTAAAPRAYEIASVFRERGIPVIMGGIHASMVPDEALLYVDTVVMGEVEDIWLQIISDFEAGGMQRIYKGGFANLDNQPMPFHHIYHPAYAIHAVQTSRGCPYRCDFCSVTAFNGHNYRTRPIKDVLDELELIPGKNKNIIFVDDNILGAGSEQIDRTKKLLEGIIERKLKLNWFSQTTIDIAENEDILCLARKSGCTMLLLGMEAETMEGLESVNKKLNLKKTPAYYKKAIRKIHKHRIGLMGTFIFGLETDSVKDIQNRCNYILRSSIDTIQATILTPLPGTELYRRLNDNNRLLATQYPEQWKYYHFSDVVFNHPKMENKEFAQIMKLVWQRMYSKPNLWLRFLGSLWNTRSLKVAVSAYLTNKTYAKVFLEKPIWFGENSKENQV